MDVWSHDRADHQNGLKRLDGMKEQDKATGGVRKVMGNLRFPLDKTYHGCPKCNGSGKVLAANRQSGYDQIEVPCQYCKGTGKK
jgi:DnaJ-class molecular chaperone